MLNPNQKIIFLSAKSTHHSAIVYTEFQVDEAGFIDFGPIIANLTYFKDLECKWLQIYLPDRDCYESFNKIGGRDMKIPQSFVEINVVLIRVESEESQDCEFSIKQRDRSRTIQQVLCYVKKWRNLIKKSGKGEKYNLQDAARVIGMSKKSLDDYFYQLRVGEKYQFDFESHQNKPISYLRKFVKKHVPKRNLLKGCRNKLPKDIGIKEQSEEPNLKMQIPVEDYELTKKIKQSLSEVSSLPGFWGKVGMKDDIVFDEQDSFFKDFKIDRQPLFERNYLIKEFDYEEPMNF